MFKIIQNRRFYFAFSGLLMILSLFFLVVWGLKPGIDFTGGTMLEIEFTNERPEINEIKQVFTELKYDNVLIQPVENNGYFIKLKFISEQENQNILNNLRSKFENNNNKVLEQSIETIGPAISSLLKKRSFSAIITVIIAIILYIAYAFRKVSKPVQSWKYGVTAIIALIHDILVVMGVFAVLGHYLNVEIDIPFVVAILTILGYSVNDTIVVFDRVRENLIKYGYSKFEEIVNKGVNETLIRSLNTSITTLLVLGGLYFFGGKSIHYFSLALIIGIISGTYSSIFLASPILVVWQKLKR